MPTFIEFLSLLADDIQHFEADSDIYGTSVYDALIEAQQEAQEAQR